MKKRPIARTKPANTSELLAQQEWDFSKVSDREIETCFYYEYARARKDIGLLVCHWREQLKDLERAYAAANTREAREERPGHRWDETFASEESARNAFWRELAAVTDWTCAQLLVNIPDFPQSSWQTLGASLRKEWGEHLTYYRHLEGIIGGVSSCTFGRAWSVHNGITSLPQRSEIACFQIDWRGGVEKVIREFEIFARARYAKLTLPKKKKPRDSSREYLKQLGALRLRTALGSWEAAIRHSKGVLGIGFYGADRAVWSRAAAAAMKRIDGMFPIKRTHVWRDLK
jgi:hypothetical protein